MKLIVATACLGAAAVCVAILGFQGRADSSQRTEDLATQVDRAALNLSRLQSDASGSLTELNEFEVDGPGHRQQLAQALAEIESSQLQPGLKATLRESSNRYLGALAHDLQLIRVGDRGREKAFDHNVLDPAFEDLEQHIALVLETCRRDANRAHVVRMSITIGGLLLSVILIVAVASREQRKVLEVQRKEIFIRSAIQSEQRLKAMLRGSASMVLVTDEHFRIASFEGAESNDLGGLPFQVGANLFDFLTSESGETLSDALADGSAFTRTNQLRLVSAGDPIVAECSLDDHRNDPLLGGLLWTLTDISATVRAAGELAEAHDRMKTILTSTDLGIWSAGLNSAGITYVSENHAEIFGWDLSEFYRDPNLWNRGIPPGERERTIADLEAQLQSKGRAELEYRFVRPDGSSRWIRVELNLVGDTMHGTTRDITSRREAQIALEASEHRFQKTVAKVPGLVFRTQRDSAGNGNFTYVSDRSTEVLGVPPEEFYRDYNVTERIFGEEILKIRAAMNDCQMEMKEMRWEGPCVVRGEERWMEIFAEPEALENDLTIWDGLVLDVTDRKRAEEGARQRLAADRASAAKSEFLSRMSHELRTPMNAILGFGQILQMDELDQGQTEAVGQIMKAGRHLLALINEVLDISRIECGKMTMSIEPMQVGLLVQEAAAMLGPLAESRGIQINVQLAHSEGQHVHADRKRLTQCLINLLSNAVKYNRDGGFVDVICQVEGDEWTALICDSGPGIPEAMQGRLFTPFDRLGAETSETEGTGLGLTVAQRLIVEMGGKLWLNSTNSNGSAFALRLPTSAPVTLPSADSDMIETSFAPQRSKRVLYIEDNNSNLALIQRLFARVPAIELIAAPNGLTGIRLADEKNPDLILLDLHLPDMEGQEVLTRLLAAGKDSNANIVILSADASPGQIERLLARGAKAYITKPIDVGEFWSIVGSLLGSENLRAA